jgi:hypothetical protein
VTTLWWILPSWTFAATTACTSSCLQKCWTAGSKIQAQFWPTYCSSQIYSESKSVVVRHQCPRIKSQAYTQMGWTLQNHWY